MVAKFLRIILALTVVFASSAYAKDKIPSLVGKWNTESMGGVMVSGERQSKETHWVPDQKILKGLFEIKTQDGRFVTGTYASERGTEPFIGMISADGKWMYASDTDGFMDWKIINKDTMEVLYRHAKPTDSVVAMGIAKRMKE